ncbi:hypothetical protein TSOC_008116 [Tetrabaena socialis]|uniref:Apple domain-containing protein n=1 Tax=Tetrabaena socialis TaxID=47790 RepID=A0A2J7ZZ95_9CHLO|nr:hypothetical protein TSOC_008116 [Tetrabaena socialis]|eukprot:PNH05594.1 hypothetical protein TSOC_008116 [Tetrabaena socialis]
MVHAIACPQFAGFTVTMDNDHTGDDIGQGFSPADAFDKCSADPNCMGFNSNGWYKTSSTPNLASTGLCLYEKTQAGKLV